MEFDWWSGVFENYKNNVLKMPLEKKVREKFFEELNITLEDTIGPAVNINRGNISINRNSRNLKFDPESRIKNHERQLRFIDYKSEIEEKVSHELNNFTLDDYIAVETKKYSNFDELTSELNNLSEKMGFESWNDFLTSNYHSIRYGEQIKKINWSWMKHENLENLENIRELIYFGSRPLNLISYEAKMNLITKFENAYNRIFFPQENNINLDKFGNEKETFDWFDDNNYIDRVGEYLTEKKLIGKSKSYISKNDPAFNKMMKERFGDISYQRILNKFDPTIPNRNNLNEEE